MVDLSRVMLIYQRVIFPINIPRPPRSPKPILDHASDLLVSANDGVQLARLGVRDQVATVLVQGLPYFGRGTQNDGFQPLSKKKCLDDLMILRGIQISRF